ncbi:hypothetical protein P8625_13645 [Tenacibaculum tangerinum]|uniref:Uncharacterized protein n=1 Tax=Tenacibaculum tangerinum TaxID=3038772 RepID=A0ABY8L0W0_9FLAO|nr:hypothetical protein [Tenacibaculum tangerinum]WGH75102.1 hypothetical protein P8625_13645 [Tenacibaculum tangerinum]
MKEKEINEKRNYKKDYHKSEVVKTHFIVRIKDISATDRKTVQILNQKNSLIVNKK